ncbi:MAG: DUF6485 family protein [Eubacterium sp.]
MSNLSKFCTCENLDCPLHPSKRWNGIPADRAPFIR